MQNGGFRQSVKWILLVCLVCSLLVSAAAVLLRARQLHNQRLNKEINILIAADLYRADADSQKTYRQHIEPVLVGLASGQQLAELPVGLPADFSVEDFDIQAVANDPVSGEAVAENEDIAGIRRRPKWMAVYFVKSADKVEKLILPIFGKGLWSTMYGFLALNTDLQTVAGITFYQHGETPGLGGEIENPDWQKQWQGKQAFDGHGRVILEVLRGEANRDSASAAHQIDGLAGATLTSRGVNRLIKYWLGDRGYGPLLTRLRQEWHLTPGAKRSGE